MNAATLTTLRTINTEVRIYDACKLMLHPITTALTQYFLLLIVYD